MVISDSLHNFTAMLDSQSQASVIIDDSEASTIVISDDDSSSESFYTDEGSLDSVAIFGFTCQICEDRAPNATDLELQYLRDQLPLMDCDGQHWGKCDPCGSSFHVICWELLNSDIELDHRFYCCK